MHKYTVNISFAASTLSEKSVSLDESRPIPLAAPDRACLPLNEGRSGGVGKASEGRDVESNHVLHLPDVGLKQRGDGSEAGVELIECFALASANLEKVLRLRDIERQGILLNL